MIVCEDSDQLINLIASQEGVDVRDETEEGTNAIDVDSLPHLPELTAPAAGVARPAQQQQFVQPPRPNAPTQNFQQPPRFAPPRPVRPQSARPQQSSSPFANLFGNFRLPFF